MLKQPCRAVGTFMVLDLTMVSPAAFMQALLSMWKIITNICGPFFGVIEGRSQYEARRHRREEEHG